MFFWGVKFKIVISCSHLHFTHYRHVFLCMTVIVNPFVFRGVCCTIFVFYCVLFDMYSIVPGREGPMEKTYCTECLFPPCINIFKKIIRFWRILYNKWHSILRAVSKFTFDLFTTTYHRSLDSCVNKTVPPSSFPLKITAKCHPAQNSR